MRRLLWLASTFAVLVSLKSGAAVSLNDYPMTAKLLSAPAHLQVNIAGLSEFDKAAWKIEKQNDGTELYTFNRKPEARAAITRNAAGDVEAMTNYKLDGKGREQSGSLAFQKGNLVSYTSCEDQEAIGRVCVTATHDLCHALKIGNVKPEDMKSMDESEMRSLAQLLTLRGTDHQLDNLAHSGNKLGLKTALQTTKGQLIAFAKEIALERSPSSSMQIVPSAPKADDKLAQTVLEKTLPRLKQACVDTNFAN